MKYGAIYDIYGNHHFEMFFMMARKYFGGISLYYNEDEENRVLKLIRKYHSSGCSKG